MLVGRRDNAVLLPAPAAPDPAQSDRQFLLDWENGRVPYFGALFRARQILRAMQAAASPDRS